MAGYPPEGYHTITPYLVVKGVPSLIKFLKSTFDATEKELLAQEDVPIRHAEVRIGDSVVMMGETSDQSPAFPAMLYVYVKDTDATYKRALQAGATSLMEPADQFYGDRNAGVKDPTGSSWYIATRKEDLS